MNLRNVITIWKKEIKDTIRDRRTLFSMVIIPILLMPVIMIGMFKLIESQTESQKEKAVKIAIANEDAAPQIAAAITQQGKVEVVKVDGDLQTAVAEEEVDAAIIIPADFQELVVSQKNAELELISKSTNLNSANVSAVVSVVISNYNKQLLGKRFGAQGINPEILSGVTVVNRDAATAKETSGYLLGLLIPLFIVIYSIAGGQYTAIDVSAGEKERKTLEALFLTPAKRIEIVLGKFLAVSTVSLTSIVLAISSLYISFTYIWDIGGSMSAGMGATGMDTSPFNFSVEPQAAILLFGVSIFLVLMFSAAILSISIYAKSFKEAESYISPAYMVVVLPIALINSMPTFEPALWHYAIPAVNAVLLFKEVLIGTYDMGHILMTFASLIIASIFAILIATKIYSKESVLFSS